MKNMKEKLRNMEDRMREGNKHLIRITDKEKRKKRRIYTPRDNG